MAAASGVNSDGGALHAEDSRPPSPVNPPDANGTNGGAARRLLSAEDLALQWMEHALSDEEEAQVVRMQVKQCVAKGPKCASKKQAFEEVRLRARKRGRTTSSTEAHAMNSHDYDWWLLALKRARLADGAPLTALIHRPSTPEVQEAGGGDVNDRDAEMAQQEAKTLAHWGPGAGDFVRIAEMCVNADPGVQEAWDRYHEGCGRLQVDAGKQPVTGITGRDCPFTTDLLIQYNDIEWSPDNSFRDDARLQKFKPWIPESVDMTGDAKHCPSYAHLALVFVWRFDLYSY
jgi:hypothetical protein